MSLALVGDVISFGLALLADGIGRKVVLGFGALLMVFSGIVFAFSGNFWVLLAAGVVGVISPKYDPILQYQGRCDGVHNADGEGQ
jgi:predicted MFS family arabinose efflux permease